MYVSEQEETENEYQLEYLQYELFKEKMCLIFGKFPDFELTLDKWLWREDSWIATPPLVGSYIWLYSSIPDRVRSLLPHV